VALNRAAAADAREKVASIMSSGSSSLVIRGLDDGSGGSRWPTTSEYTKNMLI
jgi:hypothetical protein